MKNLPYILIAITLPIFFLLYVICLGYTPWLDPVLTLPNETEILLFTVQAGIGAVTIGHFLGRKRARISDDYNKTIDGHKQKWQIINLKQLTIVIAVLALFIVPFVISQGSEFSGTDGQGPDVIEESGYTPWIDPMAYQPDDLGEKLLFSLQVAIGAAILGFFVGRETGKIANNKAD